ncbi:MAG TPA: methyltransferase domain-containing protein [Marmoricola sp.]|nr:methyltransferase domain-containing protein [Marmoricola sp.]
MDVRELVRKHYGGGDRGRPDPGVRGDRHHLTERVGLSEKAQFVPTDGEELPFQPGDFNAALMMHVGTNVPDKPAAFAEVHRVLEPGAAFVLGEAFAERVGNNVAANRAGLLQAVVVTARA